MQEKAFELYDDEYPDIQAMIQTRGWKTVVTFPKPACPEIVKEFYANAYTPNKEDERYVSFVRGKRIRFDAQTLNALLGVPEVTQCSYVQRTSRRPDAEEIRTALCRPGGQWTFASDGAPRRLRASDLQPIPKAWCTFVHHTLLPCANVSDVILSREQLVCAIVKKENIDVGRLLALDIQAVANDSSATLSHPSLICLLCEKAGIQPRKDEMILKPMISITVKWIKRLPTADIGAAQPEQPPAPATEQDIPMPQKPQTLHDQQDRLSRIEENMSQLIQTQAQLLEGQARIERGLQDLYRVISTMQGGPSIAPLNEREIMGCD